MIFSDKTVRVWDWQSGLDGGFIESPNSPLLVHKYGVTYVRVSPQGAMLATASVDGTTVLWSLRPLTRLHTFVQINGDAVRICRYTLNTYFIKRKSINFYNSSILYLKS